MPLVIAGGPSVNDYPKDQLTELAKYAFTFGVNHAAFDFPCDVVVSIDPWMPEREHDRLKKLGKPILIRPWENLKKITDLDFIKLPESPLYENVLRYSGMVAAKLADRLAIKGDDRGSYVIGIDASFGRYNGHSGDGYQWPYTNAAIEDYEKLGLEKTINLSVHSKIPYWPKQSKLPKLDKVVVHDVYKIVALEWLRQKAGEELMMGLKTGEKCS